MAIASEKILTKALQITRRLEDAFIAGEFRGYDPYDGLNTTRFPGTLLKHGKIPRLVLIHLNKRLVFNIRPLFGVERGLNAKALGLLVAGALRIGNSSLLKPQIPELLQLLESNVSQAAENRAWGYYFDWQSRVFFLPANTPSVVVTSFICGALMDLYEQNGDENLLRQVRECIRFFLQELQQSRDENGLCLSYSPQDSSLIYNASALGLETIARYQQLAGDKIEAARPVLSEGLRFLIAEQNEDGSWYYGKQLIQRFIDNYHTAYILESLENIRRYYQDSAELNTCIQRGIRFYLAEMFTKDMAPKYFKNAIYPIESHACGAAVKSLCVLSEHHGMELFESALKIADWGMRHLYLPRKGYFVYQQRKYWTNRVNYFRWCQAWMYIGLSTLINYGKRYGYSIH